MPEMLSIELLPREVTGKKVKVLRRGGVIPGVIYGHGAKLQPVQVEERILSRFLLGISASSLFQAQVTGEEAARPVIVREVQRDPITQRPTHFDLLEVSLTETLRADVPVVLVGQSPAAEEGEGVVIQGVTTIEVECLPMVLPEHFEVDISTLAHLDDMITIGDLVAPEGVEILSDPEQMVVRVIAERAEEVEVEEGLGFEETQEVEVIAERRAQERRDREED